MELPLDHFRLLGVSPVATEELVLRTLSQRLDRPPEGGFTTDALECRAELLRSSADLLCDSERREEYECLLTELNAESPDTLPALEVPSSQEVGGLILLMEAGQAAEAFEGARQALQPPQAPALGSNREADLSLLAAISAQKAGQERCRDRRFESAAQILHNGIQLLQRMGQQQEQRVRLESDLNALLPYRILDLISRDLAESGSREFGRDLLNELVQRRGGLDGLAPSLLTVDEAEQVGDLKARVSQVADATNGRATRRDHVLEHENLRARSHPLCALDKGHRPVPLGLLTDEEAWDLDTSSPRLKDEGAGHGIGAKRGPSHGVDVQPLALPLIHEDRPRQRHAVRRQQGLLAVDVEVALLAAREDHVLALKGEL